MLCCVREGSCAASVAALQQAVRGWPLANFEQPVIPVIASAAWALRLRSHLRTPVSRPCDILRYFRDLEDQDGGICSDQLPISVATPLTKASNLNLPAVAAACCWSLHPHSLQCGAPGVSRAGIWADSSGWGLGTRSGSFQGADDACGIMWD